MQNKHSYLEHEMKYFKDELGYQLGTGKKIVTSHISLPTEHSGVLKKSSRRVRAFQIEMEFGSVYF